MPKRVALTCLGILITCTALGAGLDPIRVGRYSAIVAGPLPEQADPFALPIHTQFPFSVQTVGHALEQVLTPSGYRLASIPASCPSLPALLAWPLPAVHRKLGPMRLDEALKTLAGPAHYLVVDPVHRLVSFDLREEYQALFGAGTPERPAPLAPICSNRTRRNQRLSLCLHRRPSWPFRPAGSDLSPLPKAPTAHIALAPSKRAPSSGRLRPASVRPSMLRPSKSWWGFSRRIQKASVIRISIASRSAPVSICPRQTAWPRPPLRRPAVPSKLILSRGASAALPMGLRTPRERR